MGHATRTDLILDKISDDYEIHIFASERAYQYLSNKYDNVHEIYGFNTVYENNGVSNVKTFLKGISTFPRDLISNLLTFRKISKKFKPNIIVSDFECYSSIYANLTGLPLISINNMNIMTKCDIKYPKKFIISKIKAEIIIRLFIIRAKRYIILTYFYPKIKNSEDTILFPPVLRKEISSLKPRKGDYVLVYQTSKSNFKLLETLKEIDENFIIYGFNVNKHDKNLVFKEFNENDFFIDMENTKAVITNGGFTLISEALHLKKPIYSNPIRGQFEQTMNAIYLEELGYGMYNEDIDKESIEEFLDNLDKYQEKLEDYDSGSNKYVIRELEESIEKYAINK